MFTSIEQIETQYKLSSLKKSSCDEQTILDIFNGVYDENFENENDIGEIYRILGLYHRKVWNDYYNYKKYCVMAIENGNVYAMYSFGSYYEKVEKDYANAKKYYLMVVENGNVDAIIDLGLYYKNVEKDYANAKKYFLMAIENNNFIAMNNLGILYVNETDYENAEKYFLMAIQNGIVIESMYALALLYIYINRDVELFMKYMLMALNTNYEYTINLIKKNKNRFAYNFFIDTTINEKSECVICFETDIVCRSMCNYHNMCFDCYLKYSKNICPMRCNQ